MSIEHLIVKFQARSSAYTQQAQPYLLKQEETARAWIGRALEADEIVRDLKALKESTHGVQRVPAKARGHRFNSEAQGSQADGSDGVDGGGTADATGTE